MNLAADRAQITESHGPKRFANSRDDTIIGTPDSVKSTGNLKVWSKYGHDSQYRAIKKNNRLADHNIWYARRLIIVNILTLEDTI